MLVQLGGCVKTPTKHGTAPVHVAVQEGHAEMVRLLAEHGACVKTPANNGSTPVFIAALNGRAETVRVLAELGACVKSAANDGFTPVLIAALKGRTKTVRVLAELGACVKTPMNDGATPVFIAAQNGHAETVRVLAELGACVKTPTKNGFTPAYIAAQKGHAEMVRVLAELGACVNTAVKATGARPVHAAAQSGHAKVIQILAVLKADLTAPAKTGQTPLLLCAGHAHFEVTKALLLLGAPNTNKDLKHYTGSAGNTRMLRAVLQAWAEDAVAQHRIFLATFLFGCTVHPRKITVETTTSEIAVPQSVHGLPATIVSESAPLRFTCAVTGARGETTTVTTLTPTAVTTVTTNTRTNNAILPMLEGHEPVLQLVAGFVGVLMGEELRHTQAIGPAITAIKWVDEDAAEKCGWDADKQLSGDFLSGGPGNVRARAESLYAMAPVRGDGP